MKKYLLYWSSREILVDPQLLKDELKKTIAGEWFGEILPSVCSPATALERARRKRPGKGFMYRNIGRDTNGNANVAFTEEKVNPDATEVEDKWQGDALFTATSSADGSIKFSHVPGMFFAQAEKLERQYKKETGWLTQPDIGVLFTRSIMGRWNGIRVKAGSAVFLIPGDEDTLLEIESINIALRESGVACRFVKTEAGSTDEQKEEVKLGFLEEIDNLKKGAAKMLADAKDGKEIRFETIQKRMRTATEQMTKAELFNDLLENKMGDIKVAIGEYRDSIMEVMNQLSE